MPEWRNWTGDQRCVPARIERPRDRGDLIESVKRAADQGLTVRAVGSGHSFTDAACTGGVMFEMGALGRVLDVQRDTVRAAVVQGWATLQATKAQIVAAQAQVTATEVALNGVREEARVGQRTTLDVLNAQQELVNARVALVTAQRDRVVASFTLLAAVGRLGPQALSLQTEDYDPRVHYHQVRDKWFGVRTPDGR